MPSWAWVSGLTVGATAAVLVLAAQANHGTHPTASATRPHATASASPHASTTHAPKKKASAAAVPASSGSGRRVVYSLAQKRVWLVDGDDVASRTFTVWPGTVSPDPGSYTVSVRRDSTTGSDGVKIEHIVYFAAKSGLNIAFSNAVDGSEPSPASGTQTGGIRMHTADGAALWTFGSTGTKVTVVK
ncbi:hypothetical protein WN71_000600 [Streptomyces mangrovisoli]|uniref:L,D-transpeptidase n=1 Tax=Streptomyces mangrovisoli TaxID=1428628 RepID=A0A1J4P8V7_9ACTN|nr:hypothetical protein WN71_000600 [Streptomyces mangrovisoli]